MCVRMCIIVHLFFMCARECQRSVAKESRENGRGMSKTEYESERG